jgi:hypothetical protein
MLIEESLIELLNPVRSARKCSFCRCVGHTIKTCNDERITCFEELCQLKKWEYNSQHDSRQRFALWLVTFAVEHRTPSVVKAFAISKCNAVTRSYIYDCMEKIIYYFYGDTHLYESTKYKINMICVSKSDAECDCAICYEHAVDDNLIILNCNHMFCGTCVVGIIKNNNKGIEPSCALCREPITSIKYSDKKFEHEMIEYIYM